MLISKNTILCLFNILIILLKETLLLSYDNVSLFFSTLGLNCNNSIGISCLLSKSKLTVFVEIMFNKFILVSSFITCPLSKIVMFSHNFSASSR